MAHAIIYGPAGTQGWDAGQGGIAPAAPPQRAGLWDAHATGPGTQTVVWPVRSGDWMVAAMNANGSRPVSVRVNVAATVPALPWLAGRVIVLAGGHGRAVGGVGDQLVAGPGAAGLLAGSAQVSSRGRTQTA